VLNLSFFNINNLVLNIEFGMTNYASFNITRRQKSAKTILFLPRRVQSFPNRRRKESNHTVKDGTTVFDLTESLSSRTEVRDLRGGSVIKTHDLYLYVVSYS
jgi:hypothetical protein